MVKSYADYVSLFAAAQELREKYGSSASVRVRWCAQMLKENNDRRSAAVCHQLAKLIDTIFTE